MRVTSQWGHWLSAVLDFTPTLNGDWVPEQLQTALANGKLAPGVDLLLGANQDEGATFIYAAFEAAVPAWAYQAGLDVIFGPADGPKVFAAYKNQTPSATGDARDVLSAVITDYWFRCAAQKFATAAVAQGSAAYFYHFRHVFSSGWIFAEFGLPTQCVNRTCHASELPFVFRADANPAVLSLNVTFTADENTLIDEMGAMWVAFASGAAPGNGWPVWNVQTRRQLLLATPTLSVTETVDLCTFWDTIGYEH